MQVRIDFCVRENNENLLFYENKLSREEDYGVSKNKFLLSAFVNKQDDCVYRSKYV